MTALSSYHCDVCGYDVAGFLWPVTEAPGTAGGHFVLVEGPISVEHDQPRDYFERNIVRVRVSMDVRPMQCRDVPRQPSYPAGEAGVIDLGHRHYLRPAGPAGFLWWHDCPKVEHVSWGWIGAVGARISGHVIERTDPPTVSGSLYCPDCGDHGFVREGQWVPA